MARYIVFNQGNGRIINVTEWDGITPWNVPPGLRSAQSNTGEIGDTYNPVTGIVTPAPIPPATRSEVLAQKGLTRRHFEDAQLMNNGAELARLRTEYANVLAQFPGEFGLLLD